MDIISIIPTKDITVIKSDGKQEKWNPDKIYEHVKMACKNTKINPSEILMDLNVKLTKRIKSINIQNNLIKSVADKIKDNQKDKDNQIVAARLLNQKIRKIVYGKWTPEPFYKLVVERVNI